MRAAGATRWVVGAARPAPSRRSSLPGSARLQPSRGRAVVVQRRGRRPRRAPGSRAGRNATRPAPPTFTTTSDGGSGEGPATTSCVVDEDRLAVGGWVGRAGARPGRRASRGPRPSAAAPVARRRSTPPPRRPLPSPSRRHGRRGRPAGRAAPAGRRAAPRPAARASGRGGARWSRAPPVRRPRRHSTTPAGVTTSCPPTRWTRRRTTCPRQRPVPVPVTATDHVSPSTRPARPPPCSTSRFPSTTTLGATRSDGRLGDAVSSRAIPGVPASPVIRHNPRPGESPASLRTGATRTAPVPDGGQREGGAVGGRVHVGKVVVSEAAEVEVHGGPSRRGLARPPPGQGAPERRTFQTHQRRPRSEPDDGDVRQHRTPAGAGGHRAPRPVGGAAMPEIRPCRAREPQCDAGTSPLQPGGGPHVHAVSVAMTRSGRQQQRALVAGRRHVREDGRRHVVGRLEGVGAQVPLLAVRGPGGVREPERGRRADRGEGQRRLRGRRRRPAPPAVRRRRTRSACRPPPSPPRRAPARSA